MKVLSDEDYGLINIVANNLLNSGNVKDAHKLAGIKFVLDMLDSFPKDSSVRDFLDEDEDVDLPPKK